MRMPWVMGEWKDLGQGGREDDSEGGNSNNISDVDIFDSIAHPFPKHAMQRFLLRGEWLIGWGGVGARRRSQRRRRLRATGSQKGRFC